MIHLAPPISTIKKSCSWKLISVTKNYSYFEKAIKFILCPGLLDLCPGLLFFPWKFPESCYSTQIKS